MMQMASGRGQWATMLGRRYPWLARGLSFIAVIAGGLGGDQFNGVAADPGNTLRWLSTAVVALVALGLWWAGAAMAPTRFVARPTIVPLNDEASRRRYAKRGMVAFVSMYRCGEVPTENVSELVSNRDWRTLRLDDYGATNMGTTLEGIAANAAALEHLWLIATTDSTKAKDSGEPLAPGSAHILPALVAYIEHEYPHLKVHYGPDYCASMESFEHIGEAMYELVVDVLLEAQREGLGPQEMVVDVTGGTLSLSIPAVLANLDRDRDIQVIYTDYNLAHETKGRTPIRFSFAPQQTRPDD